MSEIEKYYNGEIHVDFEDDYKQKCWQKYLETQKYDKYDKDDLIDEVLEQQEEIERLKYIIKEVRELIKRDLSTDKINNLIYSELLDIIGEENK